MKLSLDQRGIVAPILTLKKISDIYFPGIWGLTLTIVSVSFSLLTLRKK